MRFVLVLGLLAAVVIPGPFLAAQEKGASRYTAPDTDVPGLLKYIEEIRNLEPETPEEALLHQRKARIAIRDAASKILKQEQDKSSAAWQLAKTIELGGDVRSLIAATPQERRDYVDQLVNLFKSRPPGKQQLNLALDAADLLESVDPAIATEAYQAFAPLFSAARDKNVAAQGALMAGAVQRLKLPGQAMQLKGKKVDGSPFDVASLKGKVVLVDYWATWCGPCIAEMPTLRKLHEKYKAQGFEIVGVSLDEDRTALEEFLASRKLPWVVVHDPENDGQHPSVEKYGILATPTKILIGKDGKVVDVAVTISRLEDLLKEELQ